MSTTKQASEMTVEELLGVASGKGKGWRVARQFGSGYVEDRDYCEFEIEAEGMTLACIISDCVPEHAANAELIVRAVGAFGEMREALREIHNDLLIFQQEDERHLTVERVAERLEQLRKALALADGKKP